MTPSPATPEPVRLAHVSDIHVTAGRSAWRPRDLFTKRVTGWVNLHLLGRHKEFRHSDAVLRALAGELRADRPDRVVFSGDATALGLEAEFERAATLLGVRGSDPLPGLAVPGNHDYYVGHAVRAGLFERYFEPWLHGERVDAALYPFAQRVGPAWLVAVNTSAANWWPHDSRGRAGAEQLARLEALLGRLGPGPRILVTHYPVVRACGSAEPRSRQLRDLDRLVDVAARGGVALWLHGHQHTPYFHPATARTPFPVICAGSTTQQGSLSYKQYELTGLRLRATRRTFNPIQGSFEMGRTFELELPQGP